MMMFPARACWLPKSFTPRRLLSLSRPLRLEPPAFLCAMTNYFAFELFLAAALAGAASFVDGALSAFAFGSAFLAGASAVGAFSAFAVAAAALVSAAAASAYAFGLAAFAFSPPIDTIFRIVCCWR